MHMRWEKANAFLSQFSCVDWGSQNYISHGYYDSLLCPVTELNFAISECHKSKFQAHWEDTGGNLAWWQKESLMGETRGHRNSAIEPFIYMEQKAYKIHDQDQVAIWEFTMELFQQCFHGLPWFWDLQNARNSIVRTLELVQQMESEGRGCNQSMLFFVGMPNASMCPLHTGTG